MYSSFWSDIKHTLLTQWWVLLVLVFVLSINMILKVSAADDIETVYYLEFCGNQMQMFREFVKNDASKIYTDQNCILVNHPVVHDVNFSGIDQQLISQYIISNRYFEVWDEDQIFKPDVKIGNLYAAKIHNCFDTDLYFIQGGTQLFDGSNTLETEISLFYNCEIENLIYEDTSLGSTDFEHSLAIEPEPVQDDTLTEDPVQEPEPEPVQDDTLTEDPVQEPEPEEEVKQSTTIIRSASSSGNVSTKSTNATATYSDSMEGSPVIKQSGISTSLESSTSAEATTSAETEVEKEDTIYTESGNASTAKTSIDGEKNVDETTLHNDNILLTVALFVIAGIGVAMGITHLML